MQPRNVLDISGDNEVRIRPMRQHGRLNYNENNIDDDGFYVVPGTNERILDHQDVVFVFCEDDSDDDVQVVHNGA